MAIKINTLVGTNKGISNQTYVRISNYIISKSGFLKISLEIFMNEEHSKLPESEIV